MNKKSRHIILLADDPLYYPTVAKDAVELCCVGWRVTIITAGASSTIGDLISPIHKYIYIKKASATGIRKKLQGLKKEWLFMLQSQFRHWNLFEAFPSHLALFLEAVKHPGAFYTACGFPSFPAAAMAAACRGSFLIYKKNPAPGESYKKHEAMMEYLADVILPIESPMAEVCLRLESAGNFPRQVDINYQSVLEHLKNKDYYSADLRNRFFCIQTGRYVCESVAPSARTGARALKVLILGNTPIQYPFFRAGYGQHLYCFSKYSGHDIVYLNLYDIQFPPAEIKNAHFDVIIFHTAFLSYRWNLNAFTSLIRSTALDPFRKSKAVKVALPQDEYINTDILCEFINSFGVDYVFSVAPESEWKKIYHHVDFNKVRFFRVLTGYLEETALPGIKALENEAWARSTDIGYRAARVAYWLGRHGQLKWRIADFFLEKAATRNLKLDISTDARETFFGDDWYRFLIRCKYFIGVEGGASILCRDNLVRMKTEKYLARHPGAGFEETESACFPGLDGGFGLVALSPRHLEACAAKTCQILVEGDYNGILKPGVHYVELKKDFGNIGEVLDIVCQDSLRAEMIQNAYLDVVSSGKYSYRSFVEFIFRVIGADARIPDDIQSGLVNRQPNVMKYNAHLHPVVDDMYMKYCLENGLRYFRQGKHAESAVWFKRMLKKKGDKSFLSLAYYYLGEIAPLINQKDQEYFFRQSMKWIRARREKTDYDIYRLASLYKRLNRLGQAKRLFLRLLNAPLQYQYAGGVYFHLGEICYIEKRYEDAVMLLEKCLDIIPDHIQAKRLRKEISGVCGFTSPDDHHSSACHGIKLWGKGNSAV